MFDTFTEWGPARHRDAAATSTGTATLETSSTERDAEGDRPDDN